MWISHIRDSCSIPLRSKGCHTNGENRKFQITAWIPVYKAQSIATCLSSMHSDVNECSTSNGGCDGQCTNTQGSYTCSCGSGYVLGSNTHSCYGELYQIPKQTYEMIITVYPDVNECSTSNGGCDGQCTNTKGSYTCSCESGYVLGSNAHSCDGEFIKIYFQSKHTKWS